MDHLFNISENGKSAELVTQTEALALGFSQGAVDAAHLKALRRPFNDACRQRIYAFASAETQMNMATAAALISGKTASARSAQETAVLVGLEQAIGWVTAMRGNIDTLVADPDLNIHADANWPDVPELAAQVVAQF